MKLLKIVYIMVLMAFCCHVQAKDVMQTASVLYPPEQARTPLARAQWVMPRKVPRAVNKAPGMKHALLQKKKQEQDYLTMLMKNVANMQIAVARVQNLNNQCMEEQGHRRCSSSKQCMHSFNRFFTHTAIGLMSKRSSTLPSVRQPEKQRACYVGKLNRVPLLGIKLLYS